MSTADLDVAVVGAGPIGSATARRCLEEGATVVVGLERLPKLLRLFVADRGPGISEELRPRLFVRFARPRTPQTENVEGAGLGLSITKEIVERHGGRVGFDSKLGQGTTFYGSLPPHRVIRAAA